MNKTQESMEKIIDNYRIWLEKQPFFERAGEDEFRVMDSIRTMLLESLASHEQSVREEIAGEIEESVGMYKLAGEYAVPEAVDAFVAAANIARGK